MFYNKRSAVLTTAVLIMAFYCFSSQFVLAQANASMQVTPQRPSFSTNTGTTQTGWLELEAGVTVDEHLLDSPLLFKLGAARNLEIFMGLSPLVHISNGQSNTGFGDLIAGGRLRFVQGSENSPSFAGQFAIKLPTADENKSLGSGEWDYHVMLIVSQPLGKFNLDLNGLMTFAGMSGGGRDEQLTGIANFSRALSGNLSGYAELFINHTFEFDESTVMAGVGASLSLSPRLTLDAALNLNVTNAETDVQLLTGLTVGAAQLWKQRN
ncbi:MAG: transporter [bacterium]